MFTSDDFNFGYDWYDDGDIMYVNHLWLADKHEGVGIGSAILETLVRVAYYEGADVIEVSIGGGEHAEQFLRRNGFHIIRRRYYNEPNNSAYGIDAVRKL